MKLLTTEIKKTRYRKIWLLLLVPLAIQGIWMLFITSHTNQAQLNMGYSNLLYFMSTMNVIIIPIVMAMLASRLCDIENKGNTLKLLYTLEEKGKVFDYKLILGSIYILGFTILQMICIKLVGGIFKFTQMLETHMWIEFIVSTFTVSVILFLIHQILSFQFKNQVACLTVGIGGTFFGLFSMFFPAPFPYFIIWGYYSILSGFRFRNVPAGVMKVYEIPYKTEALFFLAVLGIIIYLVGKKLFLRREV
ncbi:ABC transporter permease [Anaerosacchariphilus polymeriproducens]|uniref:ABC transporter permease n=1 Tax=Anaerosacchariphilus polymeriproducens TaxID=1812858 RepID=UPI0013901EF6|nr:ABC transporter permease [Anaerosacchariphilus polymeriproducens]